MNRTLTAVAALLAIAGCTPQNAAEEVGDALEAVGGGVMMSHDGSLLSLTTIRPDRTGVTQVLPTNFTWSASQTVGVGISPSLLAEEGFAAAWETDGEIQVRNFELRTGITRGLLRDEDLVRDIGKASPVSRRVTSYSLASLCWSRPDRISVQVQFLPDVQGELQEPMVFHADYSTSSTNQGVMVMQSSRVLSRSARTPDEYACREHRYDADGRVAVAGSAITLDGNPLPGAPSAISVQAVILP